MHDNEIQQLQRIESKMDTMTEKFEAMGKSIAVLESKDTARPCPDLIRHYDHHNHWELGVEAGETRHIDSAIAKHERDCPGKKEIIALKNKLYGFVAAMSFIGGAVGSSVTLLVKWLT